MNEKEMIARLFAVALVVCCVQAVVLHYVLEASPSSVWLTTAIAGLTPLAAGNFEFEVDARTLADSAFDSASLLLPALVFHLCPCIGSVTVATLFRSLALVFNACVARNRASLVEAALLSGALFAISALRAPACVETPSTTVGMSLLLLAATVCGVVFGVRQEMRLTWRSTNALRVPLMLALLAYTGLPRDAPVLALALYTLISVLAARAVIAYNCAVGHRSYEMTRLLTVRRALSAALGAVRLERFDQTSAALVLAVVAAFLWRRK
jgi:putative effector of murein hydrolase LrgA (UPF0299 family)